MLSALFEWRFSIINSAIRSIAMPRIAKNVGKIPHKMIIHAADCAEWKGSRRKANIVICNNMGIKKGLSKANPIFDRPSRVSRKTISTPDVGSKTGRFVQTLNAPNETGQCAKRVNKKNPNTVVVEITNAIPAERRTASTISSLTGNGMVKSIKRTGEYGKSKPCPIMVPKANNITSESLVECISRNNTLTQIMVPNPLR